MSASTLKESTSASETHEQAFKYEVKAKYELVDDIQEETKT